MLLDAGPLLTSQIGPIEIPQFLGLWAIDAGENVAQPPFDLLHRHHLRPAGRTDLEVSNDLLSRVSC
jgi:hypothetical protein